jgi:hypothetical protein
MATLDTRISIPQDTLFRDLDDGEAIVLSLETGKYYGLDEIGARMWALLAEHGQVARAYRALLDEYDVAAERLQQDLLNLVDKLVSEGLLGVENDQA